MRNRALGRLSARKLPLGKLEQRKNADCIQEYADSTPSNAAIRMVFLLRLEFFAALRNIYCRGSRLSSLCVRILIERYVAGDTALEAQRYITGDDPPAIGAKDNRRHQIGVLAATSPLLEPTGGESEELVDRFLSIYPSSFTQVMNFVRARMQARPELYRPIVISRQTVNAYFLRLGRYCWQHVAEPYLADQARRVVFMFDEINEELGLIGDELTDLLVRNIAARYVKQANGTLFAEPDVRLRYGRTIEYLTERAQRCNGLSLHTSREHMAWAFLLNSVQNTRGHDDRAYGARYLASLLMKRPM